MIEIDEDVLNDLGIRYDEAVEMVKPICIGPTWQRTDDDGWLLPEHTLGWEVIGWCVKYLRNEEGGQWGFTPEQMRFVLWWYAIDGRGEFIYRRGVLQRLKGWGKDPLLAVICLVEMLGPSRFDRWVGDEPVGKPHPAAWVQIAAVSQDQTGNTMSVFPSLMSDLLIATYGIKPGAELIRARQGKVRIEAVTSNYRALEGKRTTFTVLNETHHWVQGNHGHDMLNTIDGNATKTKSRYLSITNAYLPGEDSVAQRQREGYFRMMEHYKKTYGNEPFQIDFLYDSLEAGAKAPLSGPLLPQVLEGVRGDAHWLDIEHIISSILTSNIPPARSRRMWLNQVVTDSDSLHGPETWDVLGDESLILQRGDQIVLGFDGGKTDDSTALVAIRIADRAAFLLALEEKPDGPEGENWIVNREAVDSAVHEAFRLYKVRGFFADVAQWETYIADWTEKYGEGLEVKAGDRDGAIAFDMRAKQKDSTMAHERLMASIFDGRLKHDGDLRLRRHVLNAKRRVNAYGISFTKESRESRRKVDAYAALMLAHEAMDRLRLRGTKKYVPSNQGWFL